MTTTKEAVNQTLNLAKELKQNSRNYWPWRESAVSRREFIEDFLFFNEGLQTQLEHIQNSSAALEESGEKLNSNLKNKGY